MRNKKLIIAWLKILLIALLYGFSLYPYAYHSWLLMMGISLILGFATYMGVSLVAINLYSIARQRLLAMQ